MKLRATRAGLTMDPLLQEIIRNNSFHETKRYQAAMIKFPPIVAPEHLTTILRQPKPVTDVSSLKQIPPQSTCEEMIDLFKNENCSAISCPSGTFTNETARIILNIHKLRDVKTKVKAEEKWIKKKIALPHPFCSYSEDIMTMYATLIFDNPDGRSVLSHNHYILTSDLATVARKGWISHAILNGITDILRMDTKRTSVFMLNDVLLNDNYDLQQYLSGALSRSTIGIVFLLNVGRTKSKEVYISSPKHPGCHWTLLYVDLESNKWYYCDTSCWGSPSNLREVVSPVVTAIHQVVHTVPKPFPRIVEGHVEFKDSKTSKAHSCSNACLRNIPLQTCANVCGAAVATLAAIAAKAPGLWKNVFLKRKGILPDSLQWLMSPTIHSDFLRSTLISWLIMGSVDISVIGVPKRHFDHVVRFTRTSNTADKHNVHAKDGVDSAEGSCENATDGQVESDGEGGSVHDKEKEIIVIEDSVDGSSEDAGDMQVESDGEGGSVHEKEKEMIEIEDSVGGRSENAGEGLMECDGECGVDSSGAHDKEKEMMEDIVGVRSENAGEGLMECDGECGVDSSGVHDKEKEMMEDIVGVRSENAGDGKVECDGKGKRNVFDKERETLETEDCGNGKRGSAVFFVGQKFSGVKELETAKKVYEDSHFCELWKRDVRTLATAAKRVPKRVSNANPSLTYYSLRLSCKFGGKNEVIKGNRKRQKKSYRQGCPFEVYIILSEDGKHLQVSRISSTHNHLRKKEIYERLPRQQAVRNKVFTKDIKDVIKAQANPKLHKHETETATGKKVTLKDVSNVKQNSKKNVQKNDLGDVMNYMEKQSGCRTDVAVHEENNFKGLFYQDAHMQNMYAHFPEILLVDATYKLLDLRMPLNLLMCIDGNGLSEIVAMFIAAEETRDVIQATVELFKKHNPSWEQTNVVMSDKDFTEREVLKTCFPAASLSICLSHTLRSFRREITCEKMGITSAERLRALEIVFSLAHSETSSEYERHLDELRQTNISSVIDYITENWHPIREQWVACFKDQHLNLSEITNNRLVSTFSKLKSVCSRYDSLLQFCSEFMSVLQCLKEERNHHYVVEYVPTHTENKNTLTQSEKFTRSLKVLASLASESDMATIKRRNEVLESLIKSWKQGREVVVQEVNEVLEIKKDQEIDDTKNMTRAHDDNHMTAEWLQEESPTRNIDEREPGTANHAPESEVNENEGITKQACELQKKNRAATFEEGTMKRNGDEGDGKKSPDLSQIKLPPKTLKRGRPKGTEKAVISLPRKKGKIK